MAGYSIFAHSRPDKIGTPRLLPLDLYKYFIGLSAKKSAQILYPAITELESYVKSEKLKVSVWIQVKYNLERGMT